MEGMELAPSSNGLGVADAPEAAPAGAEAEVLFAVESFADVWKEAEPLTRNRSYWFELLKAARDAAIDRGARLLAMREKVGHQHPALMEALGFVPTDIVYTHAVTE
jgi:hypothetical protein